MTPSLRARATIARLVPRRLTRSNAQALSRELLVERVSITAAASNRAVLTMTSPTFVILPMMSVSPDWSRPGVSPNSGPTSRDLAIRVGSSIAVLKVKADQAPTPGTVISRLQPAPPGARPRHPPPAALRRAADPQILLVKLGRLGDERGLLVQHPLQARGQGPRAR